MQKSSTIGRLLQITRTCIPFLSSEGQAFVALPDPPGRIFPIRSPEFQDWFVSKAFAHHDIIPSPQPKTKCARPSPLRLTPLPEAITSLSKPSAPSSSKRRNWTGSATQLLDLFQPFLNCHAASAVSKQLRASSLDLADYGIELKFQRLPGGDRKLDLHRGACDRWPQKTPLHLSQNSAHSPQPAETKDLTS